MASPKHHAFFFQITAPILLAGMVFAQVRYRAKYVEQTATGLIPNLVSAESFIGEGPTADLIRYFQQRIKTDPEDARSHNALATNYLALAQETGNEDFLPLAMEAAKNSLRSVPAERNSGGLFALAKAQFSNHEFAAAHNNAQKLLKADPEKADYLALLGDSSLELGDYSLATESYQKVESMIGDTPTSLIRRSRMAFLQGEIEHSKEDLIRTLAQLPEGTSSSPSLIAWIEWQLGELFFSQGDLAGAERYYERSLHEIPEYFRGLAGLGKVSAARGNLIKAIEFYELSSRSNPVTDFMASLGDLYSMTGNRSHAELCYDLVVELANHSKTIHGTRFNRGLAIFYADHDIHLDQAYELAKSEYESRKDILGADALAWTAYKFGKISEARVAMKEALALGTADAKLFYHAGSIERASGDEASAARYFDKSFALNPQFDPYQISLLQKAYGK